MFKFLVLALCLALALAADNYEYNCPTSGNPVHAGCKVHISFTNECNTVQTEMKNRIKGQATGKWQDPHNNGTYSLLSETTELFQIQRVTGDEKYTDLINFVFGPVDNAQCDVYACSESQVFSIGDAGTNFCNIHDLYCDEPGCNPFYKLFYDEYPGKCTQADAAVCLSR